MSMRVEDEFGLAFWRFFTVYEGGQGELPRNNMIRDNYGFALAAKMGARRWANLNSHGSEIEGGVCCFFRPWSHFP